MLQTYPSIRGRTIFRAKDRLALTKGILDSFFDMGVLQARETIDRRVRFFVTSFSFCFLFFLKPYLVTAWFANV